MESSVFELSKYLGVSPDTIQRWLRQGRLPVSKRGANYRFRIKDLKKWAATNHITLNLSEADDSPEKEDETVSLSAAVAAGGVHIDVHGEDVKTLLESAVKRIEAVPETEKSKVLDLLIKREEALSTGIGNGIAIPHPREQLDFLETPVVAVCFPEKEMDYNALDQKPVFVLFIILSPSLKLHLQLLSSLSYCLRDAEFSRFLKTRPNAEHLVEKIDRFIQSNPL